MCFASQAPTTPTPPAPPPAAPERNPTPQEIGAGRRQEDLATFGDIKGPTTVRQNKAGPSPIGLGMDGGLRL